MALVQTADLLRHARENRYAVAAVNACNYDAIHWIVTAAEREGVPVIVMVPPSFEQWHPIRFLAAMSKELAEQAGVPVAVHLDHSRSYEIAVGGIQAGFPSIMVDGSALPYEENVAMTRAVIRTARVFGVDVEAELGHVGRGKNLEDMLDTDKYTDPKQAVDFVEQTGCDTLAVAVGNAHGVYIAEPKLDIERIAQLRELLPIPLVLHGGSGIPEEQIRQAVEAGICKFNIFTEFDQAIYAAMRTGMTEIEQDAPAYYRHLLPRLGEPVVEMLRQKLQLLNPNHVCF